MRAANYDLTPKAENTLGTIHPLRQSQSQSPQNAPQPRQSQSSQEEEPPYIREGKCPRNPPHPGLRESSQGTILLLGRDGPSEEESQLPRRQRGLPERAQTPSAEKASTLKFSPCPSAHSEPPPPRQSFPLVLKHPRNSTPIGGGRAPMKVSPGLRVPTGDQQNSRKAQPHHGGDGAPKAKCALVPS